ncbi:hypothetical protein BU23DRAFT_554851 [Bimuria novae-zelandiae CBS 107.79]|uniref:F-box domain-containing protein n=1 Tax=Bimuria novae-zelandiae CBS 107.79 TaxID=1447943 RepID=A0A6A5VC81_9PLEO|nr:hypothetical protein BU23DRAFT_554851 [Bimuria novae-zelandiae CBS 107.79]
MATPSLTGMPLELLVHLIATYLPTKDLGALRLTNKYLEKALFDTFAKEFFTKKQFMLTTPSLQALVGISRHGALKKAMKHCIIGLESYKDTQNWLPPNADASWKLAFHRGLADQFALMSSGRGRDLLAEAFRNLPNLETLGIRDYNAQGRARDDNRWSSYGAPTVFQETLCALRCGSGDWASEVFLLVTQALAEANRAIPSVETILRGVSKGLTDIAFFLPSPNDKMDLVLNGLQQLLLTLNYADRRGTNVFNDFTLLEGFLLRASSLHHLRLNFVKSDSSWASDVIQRLSSVPNLLPNLRRLDLGMLLVGPDTLIHVISKFSATLRHASLWKVVLMHDATPQWKDSERRYSPWPRVLRTLATTTQLSGLSVGCLEQLGETPQTTSTPIQIHFSDGKISQEYTGGIKIWLPELLDKLVVAWPQYPMTHDSNSDDDDEEMVDEDEDDEEDEDSYDDE